ncbi:MAG: ABC transporter ATP-binding protein [bacterium]
MNAIEIKGLTKTYRRGLGQPRIKAVDNLELEVRAGEIFGFLGPNGAGKTSTIKMLMGFIFPTSGDASILGRPLGDVDVRRRVGYLQENPVFHGFLTGRQALEFYAGLNGIPKKAAREKIPHLQKTLRLREELTLPLRKCSRGMAQKIGLAQSMINGPELFVLDEPMSGLDPIGQRDFRKAILALKEEGRTVFFSSHIMADVEMVCDRVGILIGGRITRVIDVKEHREKEGTPLEEVFIGEIMKRHPEGAML